MASQPQQTPASPNLQEQLDNVVSYLTAYEDFRRQLWARLWKRYWAKNMFRHPIRFTWRIVHGTFTPSRDLLSGKKIDVIHDVYATASDEDKRSDFYRVCASDYVVHSLSSELIARYPAYDFDKLASLHDSLQRDRIEFTGRQTIAFIIAAASFLLKDVPKEIIEDQFRMPYSQYEISVFWVGVGSAGYLALNFGPYWWLNSKARGKHRFIGQVLRYTSLLQMEK
ncbi:MAG TPA: hypothetical protein VKW06_16175 [Candidatus Angelobacter sp.]|nr:hypothetical protein [Candidatus Angelobacter sp.]